jgi:hypothetical protein
MSENGTEVSESCHEAIVIEELIWTEGGGGDPDLTAAGASAHRSIPQASVEWVVPRVTLNHSEKVSMSNGYCLDSSLGHFPKSI